MARRVLLRAALFAVTLLIALLVLAPASLLGIAVEHASKGDLTLTESTGTLWHGRGVIVGMRSGARAPVEWRVNSANLFPPTINISVSLNSSNPVNLSIGSASVTLTNAEITVPAELIADVLPAARAYKLAGQVRLQSSRLQLEQDRATGTVLVNWRNATSAWIAVAPLGAYDIRCDFTGASGAATLSTVSGPLLASGHAQWSDTSSSARITARATGPQATPLKAWLTAIAVEQPDGAFQFTSPATGANAR